MSNNFRKKFKVWRRKDGIIMGKIWGEQNEQDAKEFIKEMFKIIDPAKRKAKILIDASEGGKSSSRARRVYAEFAKSIKLDKTAIFGLNILIKVIATFIIRAAGKKNVRYFSIKEEALNWLKEETEEREMKV